MKQLQFFRRSKNRRAKKACNSSTLKKHHKKLRCAKFVTFSIVHE